MKIILGILYLGIPYEHLLLVSLVFVPLHVYIKESSQSYNQLLLASLREHNIQHKIIARKMMCYRVCYSVPRMYILIKIFLAKTKDYTPKIHHLTSSLCLRKLHLFTVLPLLKKRRKLSKIVILTKSIQTADDITSSLNSEGIKAFSIHNDNSEMENEKRLNSFNKGNIAVLVTNENAVGVTERSLEHVINYDKYSLSPFYFESQYLNHIFHDLPIEDE